MPPQIKQDLNRSGWETTDFPSVCENCLPENPYVKMLKEDHGAECKLCTRPFTIFSWSGDGRAHGRKRRTNICLTCARLKNACQCCIMDLQFGLPIVIRDKALELIAPGPQSEINREYFAQNNERAIEEGRAGVEEYEKTDEKARELLRRLAQSKPYFRKGREVDHEGHATGGNAAVGAGLGGAGADTDEGFEGRGRGGRKRWFAAGPLGANAPPPGPKDWLPPNDRNIMSLFVTGIEDDLPEHKIRDSSRSAECKGRAVIAGCPLRIRWSVPKAIGTMDKEERTEMLRDGRSAFGQANRRGPQQKALEGGPAQGGAPAAAQADDLAALTVAAPPGAADVQYASLSGN
ncbi:Pre-mRNA-splicing factor slt11 [Staphylotrichum longicolle]|uniref:Pre-mRNA-splicing factor slt11 n=1 Tax=Staphylotrichum longicolle TaxID=669026 RepID=A0AAD4F264_9PEZI|nr:Pre-mRNA-splicing factor slt11 [Staphylotrichum longicolle]